MNADSKIKTFAVIPLLLLATILFHGIEFRVATWNLDEIIFATGGQKVLAGEALYKDFGDNKPPLIYYTYALINHLSGTSYSSYMLLSKVFTIAVIFLIALGLYLIGNGLGGRMIGMWSGFLFTAYSICSQGSEVLGGRSEIYATLLTVISMYFFMKKDFALRTADIVLCSLFQSLAVLYNTRFGIMMAVYGLFILYKQGIGKMSLSLIAALSAPLVLAVISVPLYYWHAGLFDYYTFWQTTIVRHYLSVLRLPMRMASGFMILFFFAGCVPLVFFAAYQVIRSMREYRAPVPPPVESADGREKATAISRWSMKAGNLLRQFAWDEERQAFVFLALMFIILYAAFFTGGKPGIRYFYLMYVPLCLLAAEGFSTLYGQIEANMIKKELTRIVRIILVMFLAGSPLYFIAIHMNTPRPLLNESIKENKRVVDYIKEHTSEKDSIFVWVNVSPLYLQANRTMATSMIYPSEFLCRYYYYRADFLKETTAWDIFLKQLKYEKPALIIDDSGDFTTKKDRMINRIKKIEYIESKAEEMRAFIRDNYKRAESIDGYDIYRRI